MIYELNARTELSTKEVNLIESIEARIEFILDEKEDIFTYEYTLEDLADAMKVFYIVREYYDYKQKRGEMDQGTVQELSVSMSTAIEKLREKISQMYNTLDNLIEVLHVLEYLTPMYNFNQEINDTKDKISSKIDLLIKDKNTTNNVLNDVLHSIKELNDTYFNDDITNLNSAISNRIARTRGKLIGQLAERMF
jgi:methyl-accepting chemotaxis protein